MIDTQYSHKTDRCAEPQLRATHEGKVTTHKGFHLNDVFSRVSASSLMKGVALLCLASSRAAGSASPPDAAPGRLFPLTKELGTDGKHDLGVTQGVRATVQYKAGLYPPSNPSVSFLLEPEQTWQHAVGTPRQHEGDLWRTAVIPLQEPGLKVFGTLFSEMPGFYGYVADWRSPSSSSSFFIRCEIDRRYDENAIAFNSYTAGNSSAEDCGRREGCLEWVADNLTGAWQFSVRSAAADAIRLITPQDIPSGPALAPTAPTNPVVLPAQGPQQGAQGVAATPPSAGGKPFNYESSSDLGTAGGVHATVAAYNSSDLKISPTASLQLSWPVWPGPLYLESNQTQASISAVKSTAQSAPLLSRPLSSYALESVTLFGFGPVRNFVAQNHSAEIDFALENANATSAMDLVADASAGTWRFSIEPSTNDESSITVKQ